MILDSDHGVVHAIGRGFGRGYIFSFFDVLLSYNLNPVPVWIQSESYAPHAPVCEFLLELVTGIFDSLASCLDIVHTLASIFG